MLDSPGAFHKEHWDFMAFGQFRFIGLPFGLANAPSAYRQLGKMALDQLPLYHRLYQ